jgi:hypothetical protein
MKVLNLRIGGFSYKSPDIRHKNGQLVRSGWPFLIQVNMEVSRDVLLEYLFKLLMIGGPIVL